MQWLLVTVVAVAVIFDLRQRRIPNALIAIGLPLGVAVSWAVAGLDGLTSSTLAALAAMAIFLPFFAFRLIGAGDVKLFGVVGAFAGIPDIFQVLLYSVLAGGVLGLACVIGGGHLRAFMDNFRLFFVSMALRVQRDVMPLADVATQSAVRIPYSVAIAVGVLVWMVGKQ